jgi:hypothetical protein
MMGAPSTGAPPGGITSTPLPPPGQPQPPMMPTTGASPGGMATGGGTGAGMGAAPGVAGGPSAGWNVGMGTGATQPGMPPPRPYTPFGQSRNLADWASQPRQQARQGIAVGQGGQSFGQSRYLMDFLARMFGGGQ